jgi:DNA recombination protein RmuC
MNQQMSQDAQNLVKALKGDSKAQGDWGEIQLERILERSGLRKGEEYSIQETFITQDGRKRPDVIINLPDEKKIIIDSKVSLVDYERFVSAEAEEDKNVNLKAFINSVRKHIKDLSEKQYQNLFDAGSLDFVLMFIPIEPAFSLAIQFGENLYVDAYDKNIVIVSPSTLLATLRTIANIWKQEYQNRNVLEIAKQSGALYDKFVGFVDDLLNVGNRIDQAKSGYVDAMKKLSEGRDNLVGKAERIKKLGAKTSKSLPQSVLNRAEIEDEND